MYLIAAFPEDWEVQRKHAPHVVNGFTVTAPLKIAPINEVVYYFPVTTSPTFYACRRWIDSITDNLILNRGLVHLTKEAAVANAKAMCSIDPESDDE